MTPDPFQKLLGWRRGTDQPRVVPRPPLPLSSHVAKLFASGSNRDINEALAELCTPGLDPWRLQFVFASIVLATAEVGFDFMVGWTQSALTQVRARHNAVESHDVPSFLVGDILVRALEGALGAQLQRSPSIDSLLGQVAESVVGETVARLVSYGDSARALDLLDTASREVLDAQLLRVHSQADPVPNTPDDFATYLAAQRTPHNAFECALELNPKPVGVDYNQPPSGLSAHIDWSSFSQTLIEDLVTMAGRHREQARRTYLYFLSQNPAIWRSVTSVLPD
jgi:hypothetical protein